MKKPEIALSLKQPWAALVVAGLKSIEVRGWRTDRRGRILIHASKVPDQRPEAWKRVPRGLLQRAALSGGIIGSVEITGCIEYPNLGSFTADAMLHLNDPTWFRPPRLFGFVMTRPKIIRFYPVLGNIKFFTVRR
jgi:hypothetical protein